MAKGEIKDMKSKTKVVILIISLLLLLVVGFSFVYLSYSQPLVNFFHNSQPSFNNESTNTSPLLKVHFLDIGQGDAILIQTPYNQDILIDGGPDNSILNELSQVMPFWDNEIDIMILTHPHSDHVAGLVEVLKRYEVDSVYYTGVKYSSPDYFSWLDELKFQNIPVNIVQNQFQIDLVENLTLEFLYPLENITSKRFEDINNSSIVNRLVYGESEFLFTGDAEVEVEELLLENEVELESDVLKVGHHGSSSSSSEKFLQQVNPEIAVIQVGAENDFNHPHLSTIRLLERIGTDIYRNDLDGLITLQTDENQIFTK